MDDKRFRELIEKWRKEADPPYTDTIPLSSPAMARCIALIQCAKQLESALAAESGLIAAELRRVAVQEAEWWHKRCCERVEVIGQPGVFQCFGCERIAALEHAAKEEKR